MLARTPALTRNTLIKAALMVLLPASAMAVDAPPMKPGLWEVTTGSQTVNGQPVPDMAATMAEQMKRMPPELRTQMEARMKARGIQLATGGNGIGVRMCITKDMLKQNLWQAMDGRCQNTGMKQSGSTWSWKFTCTEPRGDGEGSTTFHNGEAYTNDMKMQTTQNGQKQSITTKQHAKWLGDDCGSLKPIKQPAK